MASRVRTHRPDTSFDLQPRSLLRASLGRLGHSEHRASDLLQGRLYAVFRGRLSMLLEYLELPWQRSTQPTSHRFDDALVLHKQGMHSSLVLQWTGQSGTSYPLSDGRICFVQFRHNLNCIYATLDSHPTMAGSNNVHPPPCRQQQSAKRQSRNRRRR